MDNQKNVKQKSIFIDEKQNEINYGTISNSNYEPLYVKGDLKWPTEHPEPVPKPDVCSNCKNPEYLIWAYNPEIVVKEKKFECEWMCFKCFRILYNENNDDKF